MQHQQHNPSTSIFNTSNDNTNSSKPKNPIIRRVEQSFKFTYSNTFSKVIQDARERQHLYGDNGSELIYNTFMYELYDSIIYEGGFLYQSNSRDTPTVTNVHPKLTEIINAIQRKVSASTDTSVDISSLISKYNRTISQIRDRKIKNFLDKLSISDKISNQSDFYQHIKKLDLSYNFPLHNSDGEPILDDYEKCQLILDEIIRISNGNPNDFSPQKKQRLINNAKQYYHSSLLPTNRKNNPFTVDEITVIVNNIPTTKSTFFSKITWLFVKQLCSNYASVILLCDLINALFTDSTFVATPFAKLYHTRTIGIEKKGIPYDATDLRLLRLKDWIFTIIDKLLLKRISENVFAKISDIQFAYKPHYGCEDALLLFRGLITHSLISGNELHGVLIDFKKAFDFVNNDFLITRIHNICDVTDWRYTILYNLYNQITSCVEIHGIRSVDIKITTGVGQGFAISGPLFNFVVEKLIRALRVLKIGYTVYDILIFCALYADDLNIYASTNDELQQLVDKLNKAVKNVAFTFSEKKCKYFIFNAPYNKYKSYKIVLNGHELEKTRKFPYLGVDWFLTQNTVKINEHVKSRLEKGHKAYACCHAKNLFGTSLDTKIQFKLVETLFSSTLTHGIRIFKYSPEQTDMLDKCYSKAIACVLHINTRSYNKGLYVISGSIPIYVRNNVQLLSSFHRLFRYNEESPTRKILLKEYELFESDPQLFFNIDSSYIKDVHHVFTRYNLLELFDLTVVCGYHKKDWDEKTKNVIYEFECLRLIEYLKSNKYVVLSECLESIIEHWKYENKQYRSAIPEQIELFNLRFHPRVYFGNYLYSLIGLDPIHPIRDKHKFTLTMLLRSHLVYWKTIYNDLGEKDRLPCRFCLEKWEDPLIHLLEKCEDGRVKGLHYAMKNPNDSDFYWNKSNRYKKCYKYIYVKQFLKNLYKFYKDVMR